MRNYFLRKWHELADERIKDLEKVKRKRHEVFVANGNLRDKPRFEREVKAIESAIEFNKEIIELLKTA